MWVCLCCRQFLAFDAITWEQLVLKPSTSVEAPGNSATLLLTFALAIHQQVPVRPGNTAQCLARDLIPLKQVKKKIGTSLFFHLCAEYRRERTRTSVKSSTLCHWRIIMFSVPVMKPLSPQPLGEREAGSVGLRGPLTRFRGLQQSPAHCPVLRETELQQQPVLGYHQAGPYAYTTEDIGKS